MALLVSNAVFGQTYTISTVAGNTQQVNISGVSAILAGGASNVAVDKSGNLFFSNRHSVLRLDAATGILTLVAGTGIGGFSGDNGPAATALLNTPNGVAVDSAGNLYIADRGNNRIRKVSNGVITTVAGSAVAGFGGDNGPATSASLNAPYGVAVDSAGNLYIADTGNHLVRKVSGGTITTVAGGALSGICGVGGPATGVILSQPYSVAVDPAGNLYIADPGLSEVLKVAAGAITTVAGNCSFGFSGDNGPGTAAQLQSPDAIAVDSAGNLYIAELYSRVRKLSNGTITTVAGNGTAGFTGDNGAATSARLSSPYGVAVDSGGNLYIADSGNSRIRKVANGVITTVAGNGTTGFAGDNGPATNALLINPNGLGLDSAGNVYIPDVGDNRIRKVSNGVITTMAGNGIAGFDGDGPATSAALANATEVAADSAGNLYIADASNNRIRKISNGVITTIAGTGTAGFSGDNGPATSARLYSPYGIAVDTAGNLYVADTFNYRIRKISNGVITTVAGNGSSAFGGDNVPATSSLGAPYSVAVDSAGNLYVAEPTHYRIRKISNGVITTVAGNGTGGSSGDNGPATSAQVNFPQRAAVDSAGNVYIADSYNHRIRKVSNGVIATIAGTGTAGFTGDNGPAISAQIFFPNGIAVDSSGKVYIADSDNNRIRLLTPSATSTCTSTLDQKTLQFPATGASLSVAIRTDASCSWTVSGLPSWITVSGASSGTGPATVTLVAAANSGPVLGAIVLIAGVSVGVSQADSSGCTYAFSSGGAGLDNLGGGGILSVLASPGCSWTATSTVSWISIVGGSGSGNGAFNFLATPNPGAARSGAILVADQTFVVEESSVPTDALTSHGSMAQVAVAGGWTTSFTLLNTDTAPAQADLVFSNDGGVPFLVPLAFPQAPLAAGPLRAAVLERTLNPNAQIVVDAIEPRPVATVQGYARLLGTGKVGGFGIFSNPAVHWNAVVPLETRNASRYILAFDNTGTLTTGVAIASLAVAQNVPVIIRDDRGVLLGNATIPLPTGGHTSFMLNAPPAGFPATIGKRGTIEFDTPSGTQISVLGLRANGPALTTLPVMAQGDASGGSIAHLAYNGGWTSTFYLVNTGSASAQFTLSFFDESGTPLPVPLFLPQTTTNTTTAALTQTLAAGAMLVVDTQATDAPPALSGSAQLTSTGNVSGFEVFRWTTFGQEASVPLETRTPASFVLVFDDTGGLTTGVALASTSATSFDVTATLRDDTGTQLGSPVTINLAARSHTSFLLPDRFQAAAGKRGMVEFAVPQGAGISVIGLRAKNDGTLTTIPVLTK